MPRRWFLSVASSLCLLGVLATVSPARAEEEVTVRFTWKYKGEYAPLFVALDKGYYAGEGLKVNLAEGSGSSTVLSLLASGEEKIGYGPADAVATAVGKGMPIRTVALYQTALPIALVSFPDKPVRTPKDLEGKSITGSAAGAFTRLLPVFAKINDLDLSKINVVMLEGGAGQAQFLNRQVDVSSPYLSNEVPRLEKLSGVELVKMPVAEHGLKLLGASIFVNSDFAETNPETLRKLVRATNKGYADAIAEPEEAAGIMARYLPPGEDMEVLTKQVVATVTTTNAPEGKPIGWQTDEDWMATLSILQETGQIDEIKPMEMYYTNAFMQ